MEAFLRKLGYSAERLLPSSSNDAMSPAAHMEYELILERAKRITRDWAYPERRRDVIIEVLQDHIGELVDPRSSPSVQVRRWLLVSDPSDNKATQRARQVNVWLSMVVDDIRRGRLRRTFREWMTNRRSEKRAMRAFKASVRAARTKAPSGPRGAQGSTL